MNSIIAAKRRILFLLLVTVTVTVKGQVQQAQVNTEMLNVAKSMKYTPGNQAYGMHLKTDAQGNVFLDSVTRDTIEVEDFFYSKFTTGAHDSLLLKKELPHKFWATDSSGTDSTKPGYRYIALSDLPPGVGTSLPGWALTGNSGTVPGTNFIGTTDAQPVVVKSSNTEVIRAAVDSILISAPVSMGLGVPVAGEQDGIPITFLSRVVDGSYQIATIGMDADGTGQNMGALTYHSKGSGAYRFKAGLGTGITAVDLDGPATLGGGSGLSLKTTSASVGIDIRNDVYQTSNNLLDVIAVSQYGNPRHRIITDHTGSTSFGDSTIPADPSAAVEIRSKKKGLLIPRLTQAERDSIGSPATSLLIYNTTIDSFQYYRGGWKTLASGTGSGSGVNYVVQSTTPTDTTVFWLDTTPGFKRVWPLKQRIRAAWQTIRWYDPIANFFSDKRPLYVLGTGQSNMIYRGTGGDLAVDNRVIEYTSGAWGIANRVALNANNIALQFAKQIAKKENRVVRFSIIAEASKPVEDWYHDSTKTDEIAALIRNAQIDSFDVILFRQGERNAELNDTEAGYAAKVSQVFTAYRDSSWFGKSGRVLLGGLNESYINTGVFNYYQHLNDQGKGGVGFTAVGMLGLSQAGGIHIDGPSIDTVGKRYAEAFLGQARQYSLEKTPNVGWLSDTEFDLWPISTTSFPTLRLAQSASNGRRGGFLKADNTTDNLMIGWNATNNGTTANDSAAIFINGNSQVGIGKTNNTLTTNRSQLHIRSNQPIAFSIGSGLNNAKLQIDSTGSFIKPLYLYNQYQKDGNIIFQHQSGDIENGRIRFTRVSTPASLSYNGAFIHFNGSTNLLHLGMHNSTDTIVSNDVNVLSMDQTGNGLAIRLNATPRAMLHIGANTTAKAHIRLQGGVNPTTPQKGDIWQDTTGTKPTVKYYDGTNTVILANTLTNTATLDFDLTSVNYEDLTITVTGAADGDAGNIGIPSASVTANVQYQYMGSTTNTVTIRASRIDVSSGANPASGVFRASILKY